MNNKETCESTIKNMWDCVLDSINQMYSIAREIAIDRDWLQKQVDRLTAELTVERTQNAEWRQAEAEGRLKVLPCEEGTPVWSTMFCKVNDDGTESPTGGWGFTISMMDEWGSGWHLTREAAEVALREGRRCLA